MTPSPTPLRRPASRAPTSRALAPHAARGIRRALATALLVGAAALVTFRLAPGPATPRSGPTSPTTSALLLPEASATATPAWRTSPPEPVSRLDALLGARHRERVARAGNLAVCFAPGTPQSYVEQVVARAIEVQARAASTTTTSTTGMKSAEEFQAPDSFRWTFTATDKTFLIQGSPTTLTWGIVPDGTPISSGLGEPAAPSNLHAYLDGIYGSETTWRPLVAEVFTRWGELTGITYLNEAQDDGARIGSQSGRLGVRADIRIGGHPIDGGFGTLAYNSFPNDGDMVVDTTETFFRNTSQHSRRLRNVLAHEHGHGIGLDHVCPIDGTKLLEPVASLGFDGPQHDDILGAQRLYGDALEPNDNLATATDLGAPGNTTIEIDLVSIDDDSDTDWFGFTVPAGTSADITLTPVGRKYREGAQAPGGDCGPVASIETTALADLRVALMTPAGNQIVQADSAGRGGTETLIDVPLPEGAGRYYVRVRNAGENDVQMYELKLTLAQRGDRPEARPDSVTTFESLPIVVDVLGNDEGLRDTPLQLSVTSAPASGKAIVDRGQIVYVPDAEFAGEDRCTYRVRDAHGQDSTAELTITVLASARAGAARIDTDEDGYPDELEAASGTAIDDPTSRPGEALVGEDAAAVVLPRALTIDKLKLVQKAHKTQRDSVVLKGVVVVPAGFEPEGQNVLVYVAGAVRTFTLDRKGRGQLGSIDDARFTLQVKRRGGAPVGGASKFKLKIRQADLAALWTDEGLTSSRRSKKEPRAATVYLIFGSRTHAITLPLLYTATEGKAGKAKLR